mgnify:FL=1
MEAFSAYVTRVDAGDAVSGNHEFDYGMKQFLNLSKKLDCGYISCNFTDLRTRKGVFVPYKMIIYGNTDVAYVGVTTLETYTKSTPAYFRNSFGNYKSWETAF